jgi:site-specific recombinase XerD
VLPMKIRFIFDRKRKSNGHVPGDIELLLYFARNERKYYKTDIGVLSNEWNGYVINRKDSNKLNAELSNIRKKYEKIIHDMQVDGIKLTVSNFNEYLSPRSEVPESFLNFMYEEICKSKIRDTTKKQHFSAYNALVRFGKIKSFTSLTINNIEAFNTFLRNEDQKRCQTTIHGYHKRIKPYVAKAYQLGYIANNPYNRFTDIKGKSKERNPLMQEELDKLEAIKLPERLEKTRDLFVFSCYTGLAYADLEVFDYEKEVVESNGMKFIDGHRFKTGAEFYTPILPPAMKVLEKYHLKLPRISNQKYNDYLHIIEARLGLKKPLTSHVARHTFATTVALAHDVPIESVSKMLGHKDIKTTQIYAKVLKSTIERNVIQKML